MPAAKETTGQIEYFSRAMKAPRIREAAARLADQARDGGWSHEEYLAAVLSREVAAREASGAEIRARAAGFPARKSLEDFNFDHQPGLKRDTIAHLATGRSSPRRPTSSCSDRPAPAKHTSPPAWDSGPLSSDSGSCSPQPSTGSPGSRAPTRMAGCLRSWSGCAATD
jgi:hypothetical protein